MSNVERICGAIIAGACMAVILCVCLVFVFEINVPIIIGKILLMVVVVTGFAFIIHLTFKK